MAIAAALFCEYPAQGGGGQTPLAGNLKVTNRIDPAIQKKFRDKKVVKRTVGHAGFSPEEFSGHSLCAGLATSAAEAGQQECDIIMQQTRHKSEKMVRRYIRKGSLFQGNGVLVNRNATDLNMGIKVFR
jgi:hypothetical protein